MSKNATFQSSHSRNSHDWSYMKDRFGRIHLEAQNRGVPYRITILLGFFKKYGRMGAGQLTELLQEVNASYAQTDLSQALRQMLRLKMISQDGKTKGTTYGLTSNGQRIWKHVNINWT